MTSKAQLDREISAMLEAYRGAPNMAHAIPDKGYLIGRHRAGNYTASFGKKEDAVRAAQALANETRESVDVVKVEARGESRHVVDELHPEKGDDRLFIGVFPTGFSYADKKRERHGDYMTLARLPFSTLELEWAPKTTVSLGLREEIIRHARGIQARRGEEYQVSTSGQTVTLGRK